MKRIICNLQSAICHLLFIFALLLLTTSSAVAQEIFRRPIFPVAGCTHSVCTNLAHYWKLDESSGTRTASVGSMDLTDNNTVTSTTGKQGNAAQFTAANSESLTRADDVSLDFPSSNLSIAAWLKLDSKSATRIVISKGKTTISEIQDYSYVIYYDNTNDRLACSVGNGKSAGTVLANNLGSPSTATWYFVTCVYNGSNVSLKVNDGTADTTTYSSGSFDAAGTFYLGADSLNGFQDGAIDEVGLWSKALSASEITYLYNSGTGRTYPFQ